ncbi:MAG: hypothetical protein FJX59_11395 [Alphaproteobacteria bacterium]|nr:hypothetical protein [Alphaproteobacteria bacterium]
MKRWTVAGVVLVASSALAAEGTLRMSWPVPFISYGNPYTRDEGSGIRSAIFDGLTALDLSGKLNPALAESWELQSPLSWRFRLRQGVVFSNGEPFDSDTVVRNFRILREPGANVRLPRSTELATVSEVNAIDSYTVEIRTKTPDPLLPRRLNMIAMVAPTAWDEKGLDAFSRDPVGTGPYRIRQWRTGNTSLVLGAVPGSWRKVKDVKVIDMIVVGDPTARIKALMAGQLDVVSGLAPDDMDPLKQAGFKIVVSHANSVLSIAYRTVRDDPSPLKDVRVRQALNYAIDKQAIVDQIMLGTTRIASQGAASTLPGHDPSIAPVPYDPAKAKAMLAEAGYPQGFPLVISVYSGMLPNDTLVFQKVAQDLSAIGIKVELRQMVFADYVRRLMNNEWAGVDAFSNGWLGGGLGDPIRAIDQFSCAFATPFFCERDIMPTIDATRVEMDPAKREILMRAVMRELNRVGVALWLVEFAGVTGIAPHVQNYATREATPLYENVTFSRQK